MIIGSIIVGVMFLSTVFLALTAPEEFEKVEEND